MSGIVSQVLQANWQLFRDVNGLAGHHHLLDQLMIFSANDLVVLAPLLLLALWFLVARFSPLLRPLGLAGPEHQPWRRLTQQMALLGCGAVALALALNLMLGHLIYEPRPFVSHPTADHLLIAHPADASFPSDHMAVAFAVATTLLLYLELVVVTWLPGKAQLTLAQAARRTGPVGVAALVAVVALVAAGVIGVARVYVGVHYPGDIAGGAACGFVAASLLTIGRSSLFPLLDRCVALAERLHLA